MENDSILDTEMNEVNPIEAGYEPKYISAMLQ